MIYLRRTSPNTMLISKQIISNQLKLLPIIGFLTTHQLQSNFLILMNVTAHIQLLWLFLSAMILYGLWIEPLYTHTPTKKAKFHLFTILIYVKRLIFR